jgi:glucose-1-phosphate cytidylyltransferase
MKVVLFCGGQGLRMREVSEIMPKPMVTIGYRPILWHVMKYYAYYGYKDFVLCLGHGADHIKNYFLNYSECISNDFVLSQGGKNLHLFNSDITNWKITFVDTGVTSNIGQRLSAVERYLDGEDVFLANYSDGLTDLPLNEQIDHFKRGGKVASFLCVRPNLSFHFITLSPDGVVESIKDVHCSDIRVNGGYFVFSKKIFQYLNDGEELLAEPFQTLLREEQLLAYKHDGFWAAMDTLKDKQILDDLYAGGHAPWQVWNNSSQPRPTARVGKPSARIVTSHAVARR